VGCFLAHAAWPLLGQNYTVDGRGEGVSLPQALTSGVWNLELEAYGKGRLEDSCQQEQGHFAMQSVEYPDARVYTVATRRWQDSVEVGKRSSFPPGQAVVFNGYYRPSGDRTPWRIRFTKDGTEPPPAPPGAFFTVYGRGTPDDPVTLPKQLTAGMWRIEIRSHGYGSNSRLPGEPSGQSRFYLTSDEARCAMRESFNFDRRGQRSGTRERFGPGPR